MKSRFLCLALALCGLAAGVQAGTLEKIQHIVVIYGENRSFDNLYGLFPGANGIGNLPPGQATQVDTNGTPLPGLPPVWKTKGKPGEVDPAFAGKPLPANGPFRLDEAPYGLPISQETRDLVHKFYQHQEQIDGGKNDRFAAVSDSGGLTMGYYDGSGMKLWQLARRSTLADNFFMGAFGGSFLNHFWLVCACTPTFSSAPENLIAKLNPDGTLARTAESPKSALDGVPKWVNDGSVTPDGYAVNTTQPPYQPSGIPPAAGGDPHYADLYTKYPLPPQTQPTIGDRLSAKHVSWAWYAGAWNEALKDGMQSPDAPRRVIYNEAPGAPNFQPHHQPYNYFAAYAPGTKARAEHLRDGDALLKDIKRGKLPQVVFYKPTGRLNQHPGYADVAAGDAHIAQVIDKIQANKELWQSTLIIVTYDENGGFWDHVAPPKGDRWGPGSRIPAIFISPWVKKGFVDHTQYDTTSILKLITKRFDLEPLPGVRADMGDLGTSLQ